MTARGMRIGLIAPPWVPVPPTWYGGTEVVIDNLARGLRDRGHEVVLFTVGASTCPVEQRCLYDAPAVPMGLSTAEAAHVLAAYEELTDVDIIHDHTSLGPLLASTRPDRGIPVVATNHSPFTQEMLRIYAAAEPDTAVVAISHSQAARARPVTVTSVIHHGIDLDTYQFGDGAGDDRGEYLLFVGRVSAEKGLHHAINIARRAGRRLVIVAKMRGEDERRYYAETVEPLLGPDDEVPREEPLERRLELLRGASAVINPIGWPEPFGLVMAEALASGTPVIAYPNGAAPEIVEDGVTGFLVEGEDEAVEAVGKVGTLSRRVCRHRAVERFSLERMARDHEVLYRRLVSNRLRGGTDPAVTSAMEAGVVA